MFFLTDTPDAKLRLKSYSGSSRGGKHVIKIELETTDAFTFGYELEKLAEVQAGQRAKPEKTKPKPKAKPLALPAPLLGLPAPEEQP